MVIGIIVSIFSIGVTSYSKVEKVVEGEGEWSYQNKGVAKEVKGKVVVERIMDRLPPKTPEP